MQDMIDFLKSLFVRTPPQYQESWAPPLKNAEELALIGRAQAKLARIRKADYVDANGCSRSFSSKIPDPLTTSMWIAKTREELRIAANYIFTDMKLSSTYKLAHDTFPKELNCYGYPTLPLLNARIVQLKSLTRNKRASVKSYKLPGLDAELATLRKRARNLYLACEWINSRLSLGFYLDKKFGQHGWNEYTAIALVKVLKDIRFPAVS